MERDISSKSRKVLVLQTPYVLVAMWFYQGLVTRFYLAISLTFSLMLAISTETAKFGYLICQDVAKFGKFKSFKSTAFEVGQLR